MKKMTDGWMDKKYMKKIWMVGWIKKWKKIDGWWMDRKKDVWLDGSKKYMKKRWMVGLIKNN